MIIMVFNVPAESGGALSVLNDFYNEYKADKNNNYIFVISKPELEESNNIKVLRYPWIKKSWLHRLYFDNFVAPQLVEKYNADRILSLQNVIVPKVTISQILYVHNSLPFINKRFKLTESPLLWVYQNIISWKIIKSIKKADQVIVQTKWMKNACVSKANVLPEKITIIPPAINIVINKYFEPTREHLRTFFYPANALIYKNHKLIVDAALLLKKSGVSDYKIIFTIKGNENKHIVELYKQVKESSLPVEFIGTITQQQVFNYYRRSVLIFPSYIETFGLPLLEAKLHQTPVLASDMPFSHEILDGYNKVRFFGVDDSVELAKMMEKSEKYADYRNY